MNLKTIVKSIAIGLAVFTLGASASEIATYTGSSGSLSAQVTFSLTGSQLTVTLTNTGQAAAVPADVLTAVFFNAGGTLTPLSADSDGSSVLDGSLGSGGVGDGWAYYSALAGGGHGFDDGITATGLSIGGGHSNFSPNNVNLNGLDYGIVNGVAGDANTGVTGNGPLISNIVQFVLQTPDSYDLSELSSTVVFQYGTSLDETHYTSGTGPDPNSTVPELGSLPMVISGLVLVGLGQTRRLIRR